MGNIHEQNRWKINELNQCRLALPAELADNEKLEKYIGQGLKQIEKCVPFTVQLISRFTPHSISIQYEKGQTQGLGNSWARASLTKNGKGEVSGGLIRINEPLLKKSMGEPIPETILANLILHELLHILGIEHTIGIPNVKKSPLMQKTPRITPVGLAYDDKQALREAYGIYKHNTVEIQGGEGILVLEHLRRPAFSIARYTNGQTVITNVKNGMYKIWLNDVCIEKCKIKKNMVIMV